MRFHRFLEDPETEEMLEEWLISRVCEEFNCDPEKAIDIIEKDYNGLVFRVIDLRDYLKTYRIYREGQAEPELSKRPKGPAIDRVEEIVGILMREKMAAAKARSAEVK